MGAIGYTNDCLLLSPTITSMTQHLRLCKQFSQEFNVRFNVDKFQFLQCTKSLDHIDRITYNVAYTKASNIAEYLGSKLSRTYGAQEGI